MRHFICYIFIIISLFSCSSIPVDPQLNTEPVNTSNLKDYWLSKHNKQPSIFNRTQLKQLKAQNVKIIARYLIDSNGNVYDVKIIKTNTDVSFTKLVTKSLQKRKFYPSSLNQARQPVYTTAMLEFESDK
jgi:outer membrane biosynthesis protein TonB